MPITQPSRPFRTRRWRLGNALAGVLARAGIGPIALLTTTGRRTGRPSTVPVVPVDHDGARWLVAPYGPVAWVHNARAGHPVTLRYGRRRELYAAHEVTAERAGPVLQRYVTVATRARSAFDTPADGPAAAFAAEADRHPVFELRPLPR